MDNKPAVIDGLHREICRNEFLAQVTGNPEYLFRANLFKAAVKMLEGKNESNNSVPSAGV